MAEDAKIGYPAVRFGTPDMQYHVWLFGMRGGMELDAHRRLVLGGSRRRSSAGPTAPIPLDELEEHGWRSPSLIAEIPTDLVQINKRTVHRGHGGHGPALVDPGGHRAERTCQRHRVDEEVRGRHPRPTGLTDTLTKRDTPFGHYRTAEARDDA